MPDLLRQRADPGGPGSSLVGRAESHLVGWAQSLSIPAAVTKRHNMQTSSRRQTSPSRRPRVLDHSQRLLEGKGWGTSLRLCPHHEASTSTTSCLPRAPPPMPTPGVPRTSAGKPGDTHSEGGSEEQPTCSFLEVSTRRRCLAPREDRASDQRKVGTEGIEQWLLRGQKDGLETGVGEVGAPRSGTEGQATGLGEQGPTHFPSHSGNSPSAVGTREWLLQWVWLRAVCPGCTQWIRV